MTKRKSREERHTEQVQAAIEIRDLFNTAPVQQYFEIEKQRLLLELYSTASLDGDQCRYHALELKALDNLAAKLSGIIHAGERAAEKLMEENNG